MALCGCETGQNVTSAPDASPAPSATTQAGTPRPAIVIVFLRAFAFEPNVHSISDEDRIVQCIAGAIRDHAWDQRILSFDEFRTVAFPELPRAAAPRSPEYLTHLLKDSTFAARVAPLDLRYLLFVGGTTQVDQVAASFECVGLYPYATCSGYWQWEKTSRLGASLMDIRSTGTAKAFDTARRGTAWLAVIHIFPIGMPAATESAACTDIGRRVGDFLDKTRTAG
ncbi:MAG: hypothetical protein QNJ94_18065 [Alphaproteobacteria bacterium]|nr:hypothetical protein [Alphaproteobacteria bacterium]